MKDPSRWVELSSDEFERDLLQSSRGDVPSERAYQRTLTSLGVGFLMPIAAAHVAEGAAQAAALTVAAAPVKSLGAAVLMKWLGSGMLLGVVTASGIGLSTRVWEPEPAQKAAVSPRVAEIQPAVSASVVKSPDAPRVPLAVPEPAAPPSAVGRRHVRAAEPAFTAPVLRAPVLPPPSEPPPAEPKPLDASSLEREMRLLDAARSALTRKDAGAALSTLARYRSEFARGSLAPEAQVLEVRALLQAGERARASALGARVIAADPAGRHADAVRALLGRSSNP